MHQETQLHILLKLVGPRMQLMMQNLLVKCYDARLELV